MWGSHFTIWNRIFLSFGRSALAVSGDYTLPILIFSAVWYGFQAWIGGECVYVMLVACDPDLEGHIPNSMPETTGMTTAQFASYIIFSAISLPLIWIQPHKMQVPFYFAVTISFLFFVVLLIWALATMGSTGFGSTISSNSGDNHNIGWLMVYGIVSTLGSIAAGILNQNDYARFAALPRHAIWSQAFSFPFYGTLISMVGILVTAATQNRFQGSAIWNPPSLFLELMKQNNDAGTRAASFMSGICLVVSQLSINIPGNALSGGFDLAAVFPTYINIRRGAYITAIVSVSVNPWRLVNTATIFLTVLSSYSIFLGPMTGLMVSSYLLVNRQKINVDALYRGDRSSIYWYSYGINWRAVVSVSHSLISSILWYSDINSGLLGWYLVYQDLRLQSILRLPFQLEL